MAASGGKIPDKAVEGGNEADDSLLYVCRVRVFYGVVAGKIRQGFRGCHYGDQGKEIEATSYDVLVQ